MEIASPLLIKGLVGTAGITAVSLGGIYMYQNGFFSGKERAYTGINKLAFESKSSWSISKEPASNNTISSSEDTQTAKIIVKWTGSDTNAGKSWTCEVKGKINPAVTTGTWDLDAQKTELEKALGINGTSRTFTREFEKFFSECVKNKTTENDNSVVNTNTISIKKPTGGDNKYKFDESALRGLYTPKDITAQEVTSAFGITKDCDKKECELTGNELKQIKFLKQTDEGSIVADGKKATLKIDASEDKNIYSGGLKLTLTAKDSDLEVKKQGNTNVFTLKPNVATEFKVKVDLVNNSYVYYLEKVWDAKGLLSMAVEGCNTAEGGGSCTLQASKKVNLWKSNGNYIVGATTKTEHNGKTITFTEDTSTHNQGFKFSVSEEMTLESSETSIKKPNVDSNEEWKIINTDNKSYEVVLKEVAGHGKKWFLFEK